MRLARTGLRAQLRLAPGSPAVRRGRHGICRTELPKRRHVVHHFRMIPTSDCRFPSPRSTRRSRRCGMGLNRSHRWHFRWPKPWAASRRICRRCKRTPPATSRSAMAGHCGPAISWVPRPYSPLPLSAPPSGSKPARPCRRGCDCVIDADLLDQTGPIVQALAEAIPGQGFSPRRQRNLRSRRPHRRRAADSPARYLDSRARRVLPN